MFVLAYARACVFVCTAPLCGTADAEIKVPSVETPELTNVLPVKPAVGQNIAAHVLLTARNFFLVLISTSAVHSSSLSKSCTYVLTVLVWASALSRAGSLNTIYHFVIGTNDLSRFPWRVPTQYNRYKNMCYCALIEC